MGEPENVGDASGALSPRAVARSVWFESVPPMPPQVGIVPPMPTQAVPFDRQMAADVPPPPVQSPAFVPSVTMYVLPVDPTAAGRPATVDSGKRREPPAKFQLPVIAYDPDGTIEQVIVPAEFFQQGAVLLMSAQMRRNPDKGLVLGVLCSFQSCQVVRAVGALDCSTRLMSTGLPLVGTLQIFCGQVNG